MARIAAVASALPENRYTQNEITDVIAPMISAVPATQAVLRRLHAASRVDTRHMVLPLQSYTEATSFTVRNADFVRLATDLCERALTDALQLAGLAATDVDYLMFTSVTGVSAPSVDALLIARMGLRPDVKRVPMYGLGCVAGAAGIARVDDYLVGHPDEVGVLLAVELCSLTFQPGDDSVGNLVATGLFGDGAAAVVMVGGDRASRTGVTGPDVVDTASRVYPESQEVIGFTAGETGFRIQLTAQVAELIEEHFEGDVLDLLAPHRLNVAEIDRWIAHPGGPRVLEAFDAALALRPGTLDASWASLAAVGNLSSVSVLHVLEQELRDHPSAPGEHGLLFALGPGVSAELVLLEWPA